MKHVVVEGCDGSGKTNLINELLYRLAIPQHPRFVQSTGGPPGDLDVRMMQDFNSPLYRNRPHLYDRHPIISEPIYGPIVRGEAIGLFKHAGWVQQYQKRLADVAVVVFCLPPFNVVAKNVDNPLVPQMVGVSVHLPLIYNAYLRTAEQWDNPLIHDYTVNQPGSVQREALITQIRIDMGF